MNYKYNSSIQKSMDQAYDKMVAREIHNFQGRLMTSYEENNL